eukprot:5852328-Amphidinium_carterae.1
MPPNVPSGFVTDPGNRHHLPLRSIRCHTVLYLPHIGVKAGEKLLTPKSSHSGGTHQCAPR